MLPSRGWQSTSPCSASISRATACATPLPALPRGRRLVTLEEQTLEEAWTLVEAALGATGGDYGGGRLALLVLA
jgi:hypothetical protein